MGSMDAHKTFESFDDGAASSKPVELTWSVLVSTEAVGDFNYLQQEFEEFLPSFRGVFGIVVWRDGAAEGLYEVVLPEGTTMPTIRVQYTLTARSIVIRKFVRSNLLGSVRK